MNNSKGSGSILTTNLTKRAALQDFYSKGGYQEVVSFARCLVHGNQAEAEELVQEASYRVLKAKSELRAGSQVGAWVTQFVKWTYATWCARKNRSYQVATWRTEDRKIDIAEVLPDGQPTVLDQMVRRELAHGIKAALKRLPTHYREALSLEEVEGVSYKEAAQRQGLSLSAYKNRLRRARVALRREFKNP